MKRTMAARALGLPENTSWSQIDDVAERLVAADRGKQGLSRALAASGLATPAAAATAAHDGKPSSLSRALAASGLQPVPTAPVSRARPAPVRRR